MERISQDKRDADLIRQVMEYKGFAKGSRQIYMMLPSLTGKRLGLKKIRRIMKQFGITSSIRKSKKPMGGAVLRENVKPNLLRRRFRLYRPNEVRLTDVTYLDYGDKARSISLRPFRSCCQTMPLSSPFRTGGIRRTTHLWNRSLAG